jgi:histidinol-phosphate aminotransferase
MAACDDLLLYPDPTARSLREAAGRLYGIEPDGIVAGNGSDELLSILIRTIVAPGEVVAYPVPTYSLYDTLVALQGAQAARIAFPPDYGLPAALYDVPARMVIVCNPNAPTGTMVSLEALARLAERQSRSVVVVDEAYVDFAEANALSLVGRHENVVVLRTLSKSYSLAGLRVGLALTSPALARELHKVRDSYNVSRLAEAGAVAALQDQGTLRAHVEKVCRTRGRLVDALRGMGFEVQPSQANFVLARRPGESLEPVAVGLRNAGILVRYFRELPDAIRISVGTDTQVDALLEALEARTH